MWTVEKLVLKINRFHEFLNMLIENPRPFRAGVLGVCLKIIYLIAI